MQLGNPVELKLPHYLRMTFQRASLLLMVLLIGLTAAHPNILTNSSSLFNAMNYLTQRQVVQVIHKYLAQREVSVQEVAILQISTPRLPNCLHSLINIGAEFPFSIHSIVAKDFDAEYRNQKILDDLHHPAGSG